MICLTRLLCGLYSLLEEETRAAGGLVSVSASRATLRKDHGVTSYLSVCGRQVRVVFGFHGVIGETAGT